MSIGRTLYKLGFQISPIILTGGVASLIPGGMLPIVALTQAADFTLGILQGSIDVDLDDFFAQFRPLPGGTLVANEAGEYPYANQSVAANAVISNPLQITLAMNCSPRTSGAMLGRLATLMALQKVLALHTQQGGLFIVATPANIYTDCVLLGLTDITQAGGTHAQTDWQWSFRKPLVALDDAQAAYSAMLSKINSGLPITGELAWSGVSTAVGSTVSGAASSIVSTASNLIGAASSSAVTASAVPTATSTVTSLL